MRILYITYDGLTDFIGQSQVLPYLVGTARLGHELTVISFEKDERRRIAGVKVAHDCASAGIDWRPQKFRRRPPYLSKLIDQRAMRNAAFNLVANSNFDLVHCRSYPAAMAGLAIRRRFGTKLLFDMRGFWPDSRREGGRWPRLSAIGSCLFQLWKRREAELIGNADHIVALTSVARKEIEGWPSYRGAPISLIPCCADFDVYSRASNEQREASREELGWRTGDPVLLYVGSLGTIYRLHDLLRLFDAIRARDSTSRLLIVGRNSGRDVMRAATEAGISLGMRDFRILSAERSDVSRWVSIGDVAACFYTPTYSSLHVSPTKLAEYLACGVPVIGNQGVGDVGAILSVVKGGYEMPDFSEPSINHAADAFFELRRIDHGELPDRARWSLDVGHAIKAYDAIYNDPTAAVRVGSW